MCFVLPSSQACRQQAWEKGALQQLCCAQSTALLPRLDAQETGSSSARRDGTRLTDLFVCLFVLFHF